MLSEFKYKIYNKNKWIKKLTDSKENNNLLKVNWMQSKYIYYVIFALVSLSMFIF